MPAPRLQIDTREIAELGRHFATVAEEHPKAVSRAINHTGNIANTGVTRALVAQTGAKRAGVVRTLKRNPATPDHLEFAIVGTGKHLGLKDFGARQIKAGVSAAPWRQRRVFKGAFIVGSIGGHVFTNTGKWSDKSKRFNKLKKMFGPAIPKEMVRGQSAETFRTVVSERLPERLVHEITRILVPRGRGRR